MEAVALEDPAAGNLQEGESARRTAEHSSDTTEAAKRQTAATVAPATLPSTPGASEKHSAEDSNPGGTEV